MIPRYFSEEEILKRAQLTDAFLTVKSILEDIPAADVVEVEHGTWIKDTTYKSNTKDVWRCSVCNYWEAVKKDKHPARINHMNYCPLCGAKMDLFQKLVDSQGFGKKIVRLARDIAIEKTQNPNVKYMNALLKKWHELGFKTLEEIKKYENEKQKETQND